MKLLELNLDDFEGFFEDVDEFLWASLMNLVDYILPFDKRFNFLVFLSCFEGSFSSIFLDCVFLNSIYLFSVLTGSIFKYEKRKRRGLLSYISKGKRSK